MAVFCVYYTLHAFRCKKRKKKKILINANEHPRSNDYYYYLLASPEVAIIVVANTVNGLYGRLIFTCFSFTPRTVIKTIRRVIENTIKQTDP